MYPTSTQKSHWTFANPDEISNLRQEANAAYKNKLRPFLQNSEDEERLLNVDDENKLLKIVQETGVRFGDEFVPKMWPAVRWTAFAYFKRFYLRHSAMEYSPKNIMMASYYLATKVDEFNISVHDFISNLQSGTPEQNAESILIWEPIIMFKLDYHLTIHCPFRPFEGHLMEMKTHGMLGFDLEGIREHSDLFFKQCLLSDVMLLYTPTHIALAALMYGLNKMGKMKDIFRDYVHRLCQVDTWNPNVENAMLADKLMTKVDDIISLVELQTRPMPIEERQTLQRERIPTFSRIHNECDERMKAVGNVSQNPETVGADSDDD
uniref:Cyclin-H n=1 Tax=Bursaphelenchus xylophilus TaxID=6326 RepID=A0A1I7SMJ2_BURXY